MNRVCFGGAEELFMERINVDVSDLCLWETNPRVEPSIDQMDELNKIYKAFRCLVWVSGSGGVVVLVG